MAYNLRSRLVSEGSSVASRSGGMDLSPVEFAVPMSEQFTARHGLDLLAPQTVAISAPTTYTSQVISGTVAEPDAGLGVADIGTDDEQTETLDTTIGYHPASNVCGAGAAGSGPPPAGPGAAPSTISFRDPSQARSLLSCSVCLSVRPSVCPSRSWITSKRTNISSKFFHHRVATLF